MCSHGFTNKCMCLAARATHHPRTDRLLLECRALILRPAPFDPRAALEAITGAQRIGADQAL